MSRQISPVAYALVAMTLWSTNPLLCYGELDEVVEDTAVTTFDDLVVDQEEAEACDKDQPGDCEDAPCDEPCEDNATACEAADESPAKSRRASTSEENRIRPTHHQTNIIQVHVEDLPNTSLKTFCLTADGEVLAACGDGESGDVRQFDATGEFLNSWELPFAPEAINIGSDGRVYVAGKGKLARYTLDGELVNEGQHPRITSIEEQRDKIREEVIKQHESSLEWMTEYSEQINARVAGLEAWVEKVEAELNPPEDVNSTEENADEAEVQTDEAAQSDASEEEPAEEGPAEETAEEEAEESTDVVDPTLVAVFNQLENLSAEQQIEVASTYLESFKQEQQVYADYLEQMGGAELTEEQIEEKIEASIAYKMQVASISEADGEVFLATGASQGYGFAVWRTNRHFEEGRQIVDQLSGCCGQMDVQACEGGVYVAENSRHKVRCFDRNGEVVRQWGSQGREGIDGFGSCCNPMNVAFGPEDDVYTAESGTGRIKRFSSTGELVELVGKADLVPGCKKVSIAVGPAGDRVYMLDITRNHIVMMERLGEGETTDYYETRTASQGGSWLNAIFSALGADE